MTEILKNLTVFSELARKIRKISDIPKGWKEKKETGQAMERQKRREEEGEGEWEGRGTKILFELT